MSTRRKVTLLVMVVLLAVILLAPVVPKSGNLAMELLNSIIKGSKLTDSSDDDGDGVIDQAPQDLADQAGLDLDTYTLARVISSEEGNSAAIRQLAVAWVTLNNSGGGGVLAYATGGGNYGHQGGSRKVSTWLDPYQGHADLAAQVMGGQQSDPTHGATNFFNPDLQDKLHAKDPNKYKSAIDLDMSWRSRGLNPVDVPGIDPDYLRFYA
jgi:hypothetical protein